MRSYLTGNPMLPKADKRLEDFLLSHPSWNPNAPRYRIAFFGEDPNIAYRIVEITDMTEYLELQSVVAQLGFIPSTADDLSPELNLDAYFYLSSESSRCDSLSLRYVA